ncbi:MAG: VWA domain-containing protein [Clostridia bacterium]|nr:VWA domain-containing protein [Clostridia bacterium]MBR5265352.1 VWA domain-containing protein [Clostridia bacterium]
MNNNLTELVFIIDRSGSMHGLEADTMGGFNSMIERQKHSDGDVLVSTILFNDKTEIIHDRVSINSVRPLSERDYFASGSTALLDAIGYAINHIGGIHKYSRNEDVPHKTLFVITTDGMENSSHAFNVGQIRQMIERQKNRFGWEFLFLGANIDAIGTARSFGISESRAVNYNCDSEGTQLNYDVLNETISTFRVDKISDKWKERIDSDYKKRR